MQLIQESVFQVSGMTCQGCVNSIQAVLRRLEGVQEVRIDRASSQVRVRHDILEVNQEALAEAIEAAGYPVSHKGTEDLADASEGLSCH